MRWILTLLFTLSILSGAPPSGHGAAASSDVAIEYTDAIAINVSSDAEASDCTTPPCSVFYFAPVGQHKAAPASSRNIVWSDFLAVALGLKWGPTPPPPKL